MPSSELLWRIASSEWRIVKRSPPYSLLAIRYSPRQICTTAHRLPERRCIRKLRGECTGGASDDSAGEVGGAAPQDQSGVQRPQAQARHVWNESRPRLRDLDHRPGAGDQLAQHLGAGQDLGGDGVRGAGADRPLARLRRRHQFQRPGLRVLLVGGRDRRLDQIFRDFRDLARADYPPDDGGQAGDHDRPHHRRPLRAQPGYRLAPAGDRDVRLSADGARRPLRVRPRMAGDHEAAVDGGRGVRLRGPLLQHQERATCSRSRSSGRSQQ
jgi:hypothetical protein